MKIAILNIHCGLLERGAEVWTDNLASRWGKKNQVDVYQIGRKTGKNYQSVIIGIVPFVKDGFYYHLSVLWFTLLSLTLLIRRKYDWIIPVNGRSQAVFVRLVRFVRGGKILIAGHAGVGMEDRINIVFGRPDIFIALSPRAFRWANKVAGAKTKVFYIPNGVDLKLFSAEGDNAQIGLKKPVVICVSELLAYKRVINLVQAVSFNPKASLLIIGRGPEERRIDDLAKRLLGNRYLRISLIDHSKIADYYRAAQIFSLPSRESEAFGLVYLEAMACNLPVVAPDDGNRRSIIGTAGILTDVEDINVYTEAIKSAMHKNFNNLPRIQALKFSWEEITKKYEKIIKSD